MIPLCHSWGWHPPQTTSHIHIRHIQSVWAHWYAVSRVYGCTITPFHRPSWPQIWEFWVTWGVEMLPLHHGSGIYSPQTSSYIHIRHIQSVWVFVKLSQGHIGAPSSYQSTGQVGPRFGSSGLLMERKWCHHNVMVEADILLPASTLDIYTVFEP
jgi:hypothetical protein